MKHLISINKLSFLLALLVLAGCVKKDDYYKEDSGGDPSRKTLLKFLESPENVFYFEPFTGTKQLTIFRLLRDAANGTDLNQNVTVALKLDTAALRAYNTNKGTSFEILPDSLFTLKGAAFTKTGALTYTTAFAPGEIEKDFEINLNGTKWDLSHTYALPFVITNGGGVETSAAYDAVTGFISIKNKYDGVYNVTGTMADAGNSSLSGYFPFKYYLITSGLATDDGFDPEIWGDYFIPIYSGTDISGYGSFSPVFTFDPNTNKITAVTNRYGQPAGNGRYAQLDPSGVNTWDPATKTMKVKFFMFQPSVVALPNPRVKFDWTLTYVGVR